MKAQKQSPPQGYPSDLTAAQFARISPILEAATKKTRPTEVDLRAVFNAVLYLLREGCRWRSLPHDFPNWNTVYYHFRKWKNHLDTQSGLPLLEVVLKKIGVRRPAW